MKLLSLFGVLLFFARVRLTNFILMSTGKKFGLIPGEKQVGKCP
jgi:hypothetical protein